jgi:DNA-binding NarL/FixJ family response regulator
MQARGKDEEFTNPLQPQEAYRANHKNNGRVTKRQVQVLCVLASGLSSREAAERLVISEHTIIRHMSNMATRIGARNRLELLARAMVGGLIDQCHWPPQPTGELEIRPPRSSMARSSRRAK